MANDNDTMIMNDNNKLKNLDNCDDAEGTQLLPLSLDVFIETKNIGIIVNTKNMINIFSFIIVLK